MKNEDIFYPILDKDEKVLETFKPHKFRSIGLRIIKDIVIAAVVCAFLSIFIFVSNFDSEDASDMSCVINDVEMSGKACVDSLRLFTIIPLGMMVLVVLGVLLAIVVYIVRYKKTFYCCTNKRIIIRSGFIGADFETLDYDLIGGMDVHVDFLDKICHPTTGTITFASAASPMVQKVASYYFLYLEHPYETYKRIKEYTSTNRDGKLNS